MALIQIIGAQNSGKTLVMTYLLFRDWLRGMGIISNYRLNFPSKLINMDYLKAIAKQGIAIQKTSWGLDEFWIEEDSRRNSTILSYFYLQSAKDDSNVYATSQHQGQLDTRFRDNSHQLIVCNRAVLHSNKFHDISSEKRFINNVLPVLYIKATIFKRNLVSMGMEEFSKHSIMYIKVTNIMNLYNTKEKKIRSVFLKNESDIKESKLEQRKLIA